MNARLYDPVLGRMISPDNFVNGAFASQAYNRYSYANNNPLKYTDPDGNHPIIVAMLISAAINIFTQVMSNEGFNNFSWSSLGVAVLMGAVSGGMASGIGAVTTQVIPTGIVGVNVVVHDVAAAAFLHAWSGGLQAMIFGNDPVMGFVGGAVSSITASALPESFTQKIGLLGNFALGGASSALTSLITKGDPMQAFIIGGGVAAFNHFAHQDGEDGMTQYERNQQNPTLAIDAFWGLFGVVADVVEVGYKGIVSAGRWLAGKYAARQTVKQVAKVQLLTQFSSSTIDDAVSLTMKQKELHIFANKLHPKPWLTKLATQMGSNQNVIKSALQNANGRILPNAQGVFNTPVNVGGVDFIIRGYIHKGVPVINTMIVPY